MSDTPLVTTPPREPRPGERNWRDLNDIIARLAFMAPFGADCRTLRALLAIGEAGGSIAVELLHLRCGIGTPEELMPLIARLTEKGVNAEGSAVLSADKSTITLTTSGREAYEVWTVPTRAMPSLQVKHYRGKVSHFGGPTDTGVSAAENLALYEAAPLELIRAGIFLPEQPKDTTGTARRLNPQSPYIAMRWAWSDKQRGAMMRDAKGRELGTCLDVTTPRKWLMNNRVRVYHPDHPEQGVWCYAVDWGPNGRTNRIADVSPWVLQALGLQTDDEIVVEIPHIPA